MKLLPLAGSFACGILLTLAIVGFAKTGNNDEGYILEREKEIAKEEPGSHNGGGLTTGYSFFSKLDDLKWVLRKRTLRSGSSIGYHLQKTDEIYYIVGGRGEMSVNGKTFPVTAGDCVLTRPGNSHGLKPVGTDSVTVIINYIK
jgi:mannose-6-phosphate isomerase-like protein (cupin superfamily)